MSNEYYLLTYTCSRAAQQTTNDNESLLALDLLPTDLSVVQIQHWRRSWGLGGRDPLKIGKSGQSMS